MGYLLKEVSMALRTAMEDVLRPLGMTVTHYSCLELLAQRPGMTNSDLAREAFVTRQSMNVLLQALQRDGLVSRPTHASSGRARPAQLTPPGRTQLATATAAVRAIEIQMLAELTERDRELCFRALRQMASSPAPSVPGGVTAGLDA